MTTTGSALRLETATDLLQLDAATARLISWRSRSAPDQEFCASGSPADPVFVIQYLDDERRYRRITSLQAEFVSVRGEGAALERRGPGALGAGLESRAPGGADLEPRGPGEADLESRAPGRVIATYSRLAGLDLEVTVTIEVGESEYRAFPGASRWRLSLHNGAGLRITDVQFPFVVLRYHLDGAPGSEALLWPYGPGVLLQAPQPQDLAPDDAHTWQLRPENGDTWHYPGYTVAQLQAYYNNRAGAYVACNDAQGRIKLLRPVHHEPGLRLGLAHVGDWPANGDRALEYDVLLGTFQGDWMAAADLYRAWALQQPWAQHPLHERRDVPSWLLDSPPHIVVRIQGELDIGPAEPNETFLPYHKIVPHLEALASKLEMPVLPVIMSWERPGPWIYPDCFPPAGGSESLREFCDLARERGWHVGTFCNGTRWVVAHYWSHYDGRDYYEAEGGRQSVCLTHDGRPWEENWDSTWRPSYACCVGAAKTREIAVDFVRTCLDLGLDWVQFFDQNVGCAPFPCFSAEHGHVEEPGAWMTEEMGRLLMDIRGAMDEANHVAGGERPIVLSVEGPANEYALPAFGVCDIRVVPPGHSAGGLPFVPLYHYLYHELIVIQGGFGTGPEPYHMPIRSAYNLTTGEIPGAVLTGDGRLLNADTWNWAPWEPPIGDNEAALGMLKATAALRRGPARDFLVFGRMMHPAEVTGIPTMRWQHGGRDHQIPAVFHSAWRAPDGRMGVVLANWTTDVQTVRVRDARLGIPVRQTVSGPQGIREAHSPSAAGGLIVAIPALSCALLA